MRAEEITKKMERMTQEEVDKLFQQERVAEVIYSGDLSSLTIHYRHLDSGLEESIEIPIDETYTYEPEKLTELIQLWSKHRGAKFIFDSEDFEDPLYEVQDTK